MLVRTNNFPKLSMLQALCYEHFFTKSSQPAMELTLILFSVSNEETEF